MFCLPLELSAFILNYAYYYAVSVPEFEFFNNYQWDSPLLRALQGAVYWLPTSIVSLLGYTFVCIQMEDFFLVRHQSKLFACVSVVMVIVILAGIGGLVFYGFVIIGL
jgi:hypothetical protein